MLKAKRQQASTTCDEHPSIIDTAQFRKLVLNQAAGAEGRPNDQEQEHNVEEDHSDDLLAVTDKFRALDVPETEWLDDFDLDAGTDPYNNLRLR